MAKLKNFTKKISLYFLRLFALLIIVFFAVVLKFSTGLPDVSIPENLTSSLPTEIYDRDGNILYTIYSGENRSPVTYDQVSPNLVHATVAMEDENFWHHKGIDIKGIANAVLYEFFHVGSKRGGSTISQQYIKNQFLTPEKTYTRKIKELILAKNLEYTYGKKDIFTMYINQIPYGNNAYGCEKAAQIYFNKSCINLTIAESAILAGIPQAPSYYNPYGNHKYSKFTKSYRVDEVILKRIKNFSDLGKEDYQKGLIGQEYTLANGKKIYIPGRADLVLQRMVETGYISYIDKAIATKQLHQIVFQPYVETIKYPHFVFYIKEYLEKTYGKDFLEHGGLKVYTTLDPHLQEVSEQVVAEKRDKNLYRYGANNASTLTINPKTGEILAMVGSVDYFNTEIDGNVNVALRPRQPGSSFKPIVYARAFYEGYAPGNTIYDIPTRFGDYTPQNYDGKFMGQMTIRRALAQSRNIPAVKAYFLAGEQEAILDFAKKLGITSLDPERYYGYSLGLGSGEVSLIEMVQAYSVFANNGGKADITGILKIVDRNGKIIDELKPSRDEVVDPQVAYLINNVLSDQRAGIGRNLYVNGQLNAAKTGTSTKNSKSKGSTRPGDVWTIGYTPSYVTGVWVGNTDGAGLGYRANGYDVAAPMFNAIMTEALKGTAAEPFPEPEGIIRRWITRATGSFVNDKTPTAYRIYEVYASFSNPPSTNSKIEVAGTTPWQNNVKAYLTKLTEIEEKKKEKEEEEKIQQEIEKAALSVPDNSGVKSTIVPTET